MPIVLVKTLKNIKKEVINTIFSIFGPLKAIKSEDERIIADYVSFEDASRAVSILNNKVLFDGQKISASLYYNNKKRVVIKNIYSIEDIKKILSKYGKIYNIESTPLFINVDFYSEDDAKRVLNSCVLAPDGKERLVIKSPSNTIVKDSQTVILYNIPENCESKILKKLSRFGEIVSSAFNKTKAFINYSKASFALKASKVMNNKIFKRRKIVAIVKQSKVV